MLGILIFVFAAAINWWCDCFSLNLLKNEEISAEQSLKVMCFNINGDPDNITDKSKELLEIVVAKNPDVIFFAELPDRNNVLDSLVKEIFHYSAYGNGYLHNFYSKYPLGVPRILNDGDEDVGVYMCPVIVNNDSVILYGCHLASNNYTADRKYVTPDSINDKEDLVTYFHDIQLAYRQRTHEVEMLVSDMDYDKTIVLGDFNDVGGSKVVKKLEKLGLRDAWWEGGCGYGATIQKPLPYRIDHIMYSSGIVLRKIEVVSSRGLSDHDALYAEFCLN